LNSVKYGYRPIQWAHGPRWSTYDVDGDRWFGFRAVRVVPGTDSDIVLVPLIGHTEGHCGVAVKTANGWLLHAGDCYFSQRELELSNPREAVGSGLFQRLRSSDNSARRDNVARLRQLRREHAEVQVFSAHCPGEFARLTGSDEVSAA
jgi:glyoxylase-like metal-dependent hydrolase (beta-lactamase superfamily II)